MKKPTNQHTSALSCARCKDSGINGFSERVDRGRSNLGEGLRTIHPRLFVNGGPSAGHDIIGVDDQDWIFRRHRCFGRTKNCVDISHLVVLAWRG